MRMQEYRLRPTLLVLVLLCCVLLRGQRMAPPEPKREVRAVWLATIGGLDWPQSYASSAAGIARQRQQLGHLLDRLQQAGINTVLLQTRIRSTVIYPSEIEPWDGCLSGRPARSPGYDPLAYAIDECHRRGMELHAWMVCMPACNDAMARQLGTQALPRKHPELCRKTVGGWTLDPGVPATADYLAALCREVTARYDIDGVHLDYIRYPEKEAGLNDAATYRRYGNGHEKSAWRRANITRIVERIATAVKKEKPWVKLSCAPVGKHADLPRYSSRGWNALNAVHQEAQAWLQTGLMDMLLPMMYFDGDHFYPFAADWHEADGGCPVVPGLGVYLLSSNEKNWPLGTLTRQLCFVRKQSMGGQAFYRARFVADNTKGIADYLHTFYYTAPALPPALTRVDSIAPTAPAAFSVEQQKGGMVRFAWHAATDPTPGSGLRYNLYASTLWPVDTDNPHNIVRLGLRDHEVTLFYPQAAIHPVYFALRAIDRFGNEGTAATWGVPLSTGATTACLIAKGKAVAVPENSYTPWLLIDAEGRTLDTFVPSKLAPADSGRARLVPTKDLAPGLYTIEAMGPRRKSPRHRVCTFIVKPPSNL